MATTYRYIDATPEQVFETMSEGWLYANWVVGASRTRFVDADFPAVGSRIHHSFGVWPFLLDDTSEIVACEPPRRLEIHASGQLLGTAQIVFDLKARGGGTVVRMQERAIRGLGALVPSVLLDPPLHLRNVEALRRLGYIAAGRANGGQRA